MIKWRIFFFLMLGAICSPLFALAKQTDDIYVSGHIQGYAGGAIYLLQYNNSSLFAYEVADSTRTDSAGFFHLRQPSAPGMYRLCQGKGGWYNSNPGNTLHLWLGFGEEVEFHTTVNDFTKAVQFSKGRYNTWWFANERYLQPYMQRLGITMQLLDVYPAGPFYARIQEEYLQVQEEYKAAWMGLKRQQPTNILLDDQRRLVVPFTGSLFKKQDRTRYWQQHLLDSVDFSQPSLQASHLLGQRLQQYMEMYGYPYAFDSRTAMDSGLLVAVKGIIVHCQDGDFSRNHPASLTASLQFASAWLYNFCTDKGLDQCLAYTAGQMTADVVTNTCNASPGTLQTLQRMQASQKLKPGMAAPEITLGDTGIKKLADVKAPKTLVLFWASWCPHCQQELPLLKKLYDSIGHKNWEVLAVSIDTSMQAWVDGVRAGGYNWLNYCDRRGVGSPPGQETARFFPRSQF